MPAVIFDIDGTLIESANEDDLMYRRAVCSVIGEVTFREMHDYFPVTDVGILKQVFADNEIPETDEMMQQICAAFVDATHRYIDRTGPFREIPGAREFVHDLKVRDGIDVGIATGGWQATAILKLSTAGFDVNGIPVRTSDDAQHRTEIMQLALDAMHATHDHVIYYGDGSWDRDACDALGWEFRAVGSKLGGIQSYHDEEI